MSAMSTKPPGREHLKSLFVEVYDELRRMAAAKMAGEPFAHTLSATALVNEAFLKLPPDAIVQDDRHLVRIAARIMNQVLIDSARRKGSIKRGAHARADGYDLERVESPRPTVDPEELAEELDLLEAIEPLAAEVVRLRCYGQFGWQEIAELLDLPQGKVDSLWEYAKRKLAVRLRPYG